MNQETLKPCPFCGGSAKAMLDLEYNAWEKTLWEVSCGSCYAVVGPVEGKNKAIHEWNKRNPTTPRDEREAFEDYIDSEGLWRAMPGERGAMKDGRYIDPLIAKIWQGWQARASLAPQSGLFPTMADENHAAKENSNFWKLQELK